MTLDVKPERDVSRQSKENVVCDCLLTVTVCLHVRMLQEKGLINSVKLLYIFKRRAALHC